MKKRIKQRKEILNNKKVIIPLIIVLVFFIYKGFYLCCFYLNKEESFDRLYFKNSIVLDNEKDNDYLEFKNIKIRNDFDKFILSKKEDNYITYNLINKFNKVQASLQIISDKTYIDKFIENDYHDIRYNSVDREKIIKNNHITNDIEFIKYLRKVTNKKNNILTGVNDIKERYSLKYFINKEIPKFDYLTLIKGDYTGYIFDNFNYSNDQYREAVILKNNRRYIFRFHGCCYFDESYVEELLSTVVID